jgi:hypothetical protein
MTAAAIDLLAEIRRSGGDVKVTAPDRLKVIAPAKLLPDLVERVRAVKPELLSVLVTVESHAAHPSGFKASPAAVPIQNWDTRHREALAYWRAMHSNHKAELLAWGEMENRWHQLHGERIAPHLCAGCGELIGGLPSLEVGHGNRVHVNDLHCVIRFGGRWRSAATAALRSLGLDAPTGIEPL